MSNIQSEDILKTIRAFIKGSLPKEEELAFRERMRQDPELEDKVAFVRLMVGGLQEVSNNKKAKRKKWALIIVLILLSILGLYLVFSFQLKEREGQDKLPVFKAKENQDNQSTGIQAASGGSTLDIKYSDRPSNIIWNGRGEAIVSGQYKGISRFGNYSLPELGSQGIFLAACNVASEFVWAKQFGSKDGPDLCEKIALDNDGNILMTGSVYNNALFGDYLIQTHGTDDLGSRDLFVSKMDPVGKVLWIDHAGGFQIPNKQTGCNMGNAIATDRENNIIVAGGYIGTPTIGGTTLPVGGPNEDMFLAKYSPEGIVKWATAATGTYMLYPNEMAIDMDGNIYLIGFFGHHNLSGSATFGDVHLKSFGGGDVFIAKYSSDGDLIWAKQAGSPDIGTRDIGSNIAVGKDGTVVVSGFFTGLAHFENINLSGDSEREIFMAKYDTNGNVIWAISEGGNGKDESHGLCLDKNGYIYATGCFAGKAKFGSFELTSLGKEDFYVAKYTPDGEILWIRQAGGEDEEINSDSASGISINESGQVVVTGTFTGKMTIGGKSLISTGKEDVFLIFFDSDGHLLNAKQLLYQS